VAQQHHQLLAGYGGKLPLLTGKLAGQAAAGDGRKDTGRTKGARDASGQKRSKEANAAALAQVDSQG